MKPTEAQSRTRKPMRRCPKLQTPDDNRGAVGAHAFDRAPAGVRGGIEAVQQRALRLQDVVGRTGYDLPSQEKRVVLR